MSDEIVIEFADQLKCCVCQDTIKDPRILPCGHTLCTGCVTGCIGASDFGGLLECPECKHSAPVANVARLPSCAVINDLLGKLKTKAVAMDPKSPKMMAIFQCPICNELLEDARILPCGQSFCRDCLTTRMVAKVSTSTKGKARSKSGQVHCQWCGELHDLPAGGVNMFPVNFRVNGVVEELKSGGKKKTRPRSSDAPSNGHVQGQKGRSTGAGGFHEDVDLAKKRAQRAAQPMEWQSQPGVNGRYRAPHDDVDEQKRRAKQAQSNRIQVLVNLPTGKTITIDANVNDSVDNLKRKIRAAVGVDGSQQTLTFNGRNLNQGTLTLWQCGIGNHATLRLNYRLSGGNIMSD